MCIIDVCVDACVSDVGIMCVSDVRGSRKGPNGVQRGGHRGSIGGQKESIEIRVC